MWVMPLTSVVLVVSSSTVDSVVHTREANTTSITGIIANSGNTITGVSGNATNN